MCDVGAGVVWVYCMILSNFLCMSCWYRMSLFVVLRFLTELGIILLVVRIVCMDVLMCLGRAS